MSTWCKEMLDAAKSGVCLIQNLLCFDQFMVSKGEQGPTEPKPRTG